MYLHARSPRPEPPPPPPPSREDFTRYLWEWVSIFFLLVFIQKYSYPLFLDFSGNAKRQKVPPYTIYV